jgi:prepilin-type N-terminal cleavage/methylation domain-containing protein
MRNYFSPNKSGFTLIEVIVSLALFSVVITIAVGALLILIASNRQLQNEQSVLSNLSFALDSMTREIRTGSNYYCAARPNPNSGPPLRRIFEDNRVLSDVDSTFVGDCPAGNTSDHQYHGISFVEGGNSVTDGTGSKRIVYFHDQGEGKLYRRLSGEASESIVSDGIYLSDVDFYVTGPDRPVDSDELQPKITIVIQAYNSEDDFIADDADGVRDRAYVIQTTVTQRTLDI